MKNKGLYLDTVSKLFLTKNYMRMCLLIFFLTGLPLFAEIHEIKAIVKGLSCPFCVYGLEKNLKKVAGVTGVTTNFKKGEVLLTYSKTSLFNAKSVGLAVKKGGFTLSHIQILASGNVNKKGKDFILTTSKDLSFVLLKKHSKDKKNDEIFSDKTKQVLAEAIKNKKSIRVNGQIHFTANAPNAILMDSVRVSQSKGL